MHNDGKIVKAKLAEFYDSDSREYHEVHYPVKQEQYSPLRYRQFYIESMIDELQLPRSAKILDVGCGPGELSLSLLSKGYEAWGLDISEGMIREARRTAQKKGIQCPDRFSVGDIEDLGFKDGFFQVVVASGVIEYQKSDEKALSEMKRVLGHGGYLILNVTNRWSYIYLFDSFYRWLKKHAASRAVINFLKKDVLGRGILHDLPDRRTHFPFSFDKKLLEFGFTKITHNYFHFSPLPIPFDSLFNSICGRLGIYMEGTLTNSRFGVIGGGYIVMARKA